MTLWVFMHAETPFDYMVGGRFAAIALLAIVFSSLWSDADCFRPAANAAYPAAKAACPARREQAFDRIRCTSGS